MSVDFQSVVEGFGDVFQWIIDNKVSVILSAEIVGAVIAVKMGKYKRGVVWLIAALVTIWVG